MGGQGAECFRSCHFSPPRAEAGVPQELLIWACHGGSSEGLGYGSLPEWFPKQPGPVGDGALWQRDEGLQ